MKASRYRIELLLAAALTGMALAGCAAGVSAEGSFDKTFEVSGPIRIEMVNGSGDSKITAGPAGQVQIHGEIQVHAWSDQSGQRRVDELQTRPPVSQEGSLIRIGGSTGDASIDYTIVVPADAQIRATTGSGDLEVSGLKGPANFISGSGDLKVSNISNDVQANTGSGEVALSDVTGQVQVNTGSGDITLDRIHGDLRMQTGSGSIEVTAPSGKLEANTSSGDVTVRGASSDLRIHTSSGDVTIEGNPAPSSYWDFRTNSGDVELQVGTAASFRLYARTSSGDVEAAIPMTMEGTSGKHEFQARIGDGKARVEISSSSGDISLK